MPKRVNHDRRREHLLVSALAVFQEKGYADTNLADVASRAELSRPTLYQYFPDKDGLFHDSIKFVTDQMLEGFQRAAEGGGPVKDRLNAIFTSLIDSFFSNRKLLSTLFDFLVGIRDRSAEYDVFLRRRTIAIKRLFVRLAIEGIKSGELEPQSPGAVVSLLLSFIQSLFIQIAIVPLDSRDQFVRVAEIYVESLKRK